MSSPDVVSLLENSKELDRVRKEQEEILSEINKLHKKLQTSQLSLIQYFFLPDFCFFSIASLSFFFTLEVLNVYVRL